MKILTCIALLAVSTATYGKPKSKTFRMPCKDVFAVAEDMSSKSPYKILLDGKADMILRVETGSFWKAGASSMDVQFKQANTEGCEVTVSAPYSGLMKNGTVYLNRLEKKLAEKQ